MGLGIILVAFACYLTNHMMQVKAETTNTQVVKFNIYQGNLIWYRTSKFSLTIFEVQRSKKREGRFCERCILAPYLGAVMVRVSCNNSSFTCTVLKRRMSHRKRREIKQEQTWARRGYLISCSYVSLHFLWDILCSNTVLQYVATYFHTFTRTIRQKHYV